MALVEGLQKAIEFMETNLQENITIEDIAEKAHLSSYHFQRTFTILTDMTVAEYLRRRRLTKAAHELSTTNIKIIDLALKYGYQTPESFTKAFQKQHGMSPSEARKGNSNFQSYNRLTIQVNLKGDKPMNYRIIEREAFPIIGVKKTFQCNEDFNQSIAIGQFWAQIGQEGMLDRIVQLNNGEITGLIGATVDYKNETNEIEYWVATESDHEIASELLQYEIPSAKWVVFEAKGPVAKAVPEIWKKIYSEWFPSNDYEHTGAPSLEVYKSADPTSESAVTEIWIPIK